LLHEWSKLRYGVYEEYPLPGEPKFYSTEEGFEATRCSGAIQGINDDMDVFAALNIVPTLFSMICIGTQYDPNTSRAKNTCEIKDNLPTASCEFRPRPDSTKKYASLMYYQNLDMVNHH
jgi:hypothetical protein